MRLFFAISLAIISFAQKAGAQIQIPFDQYQLTNGLTVILHEDHSAPVITVAVTYHVGSKNEKPGRTGFAHLFEHMMFQGSKNVGDDEYFKILQEIGGQVNGFTMQDGTVYYEVIPSNYLELALFMEADRMGFLLPALTQGKLDNQRDVVKNERRERYDNQPYGTARETILAALYPTNHPYHWPVIGSMEDLSAASLEDVTEFFRTFYVPNNAVLVVAGDLKSDQTKEWIEKYFSSIPKGEPVIQPLVETVNLKSEIRKTLEDNVQLPRIYMSWHSPKDETREDAVLDVFSHVLVSGKNSRLYRKLVYEDQIAQDVSAEQDGSELTGRFQIVVTPKPGTDIAQLESQTLQLVNDVIENGVDLHEIQKAITAVEVGLIDQAETVRWKAILLSLYQSFTGDANNINRQMDLYREITSREIQETAKKYLSNPKVTLTVVPRTSSTENK